MARTVGCITTVVALLLLGWAVLESPLQGQQTPQTIRCRTTLVPIDIRVVDLRGNPDTDLKKEDSTVQEDGIRQEIRLFETHTLTPEPPQAGGPPLRKALTSLTRRPWPVSVYDSLSVTIGSTRVARWAGT